MHFKSKPLVERVLNKYTNNTLKMDKTRKTLLWLDNTRNPYQGSWLFDHAPEYETKNAVSWIKNHVDFAKWITENGLPDMIAFSQHSEHSNVEWLVEYCSQNKCELPSWIVIRKDDEEVDNIKYILMNYSKPD